MRNSRTCLYHHLSLPHDILSYGLRPASCEPRKTPVSRLQSHDPRGLSASRLSESTKTRLLHNPITAFPPLPTLVTSLCLSLVHSDPDWLFVHLVPHKLRRRVAAINKDLREGKGKGRQGAGLSGCRILRAILRWTKTLHSTSLRDYFVRTRHRPRGLPFQCPSPYLDIVGRADLSPVPHSFWGVSYRTSLSVHGARYVVGTYTKRKCCEILAQAKISADVARINMKAWAKPSV